MKVLRVLILVGQIGRIWAKSHKARKMYSTITVVGLFSLLNNNNNSNKDKEDE